MPVYAYPYARPWSRWETKGWPSHWVQQALCHFSSEHQLLFLVIQPCMTFSLNLFCTRSRISHAGSVNGASPTLCAPWSVVAQLQPAVQSLPQRTASRRQRDMLLSVPLGSPPGVRIRSACASFRSSKLCPGPRSLSTCGRPGWFQ